MWWDRSRSVEIYLGTNLVGIRWHQEEAAWSEVDDLQDGLMQIAAWVKEGGTQAKARVWLASGLAQPFLIPAGSGAKNRSEAKMLAMAVAKRLLNDPSEPTCWCDRWSVGQTTLAAGVSSQVWSLLQELAAGDRRVRISSVRPWWNQMLEGSLRRSEQVSGLSLEEPDGVMFAKYADGRVLEIGFERPKAYDPDWRLTYRRLETSWADMTFMENFCFSRQSAVGIEFAIGSATVVEKLLDTT